MEANVPATVDPRAIRPADEVAFATDAARVLVDIVKKGKLAKNLGGVKDHIMYEGWATVAKFYGCTIKIIGVIPTGPPADNFRVPGYTARAVVIDSTGREIGAAENSCERDENTWRNRSNYALISMAQTRAGSKAARMVFSWVVVLAGYAPTPLEEMPENGHPEPEPPVSKGKSGGFKEFLRLMSEMKAEVGDEAYYSVLGTSGFQHANEIKDREVQKNVYWELRKVTDGLKATQETFPETEE